MRPGFVILAAFDAAIIDLDGTMVDTLGDFAEALNRMLRDLELPPIAAQHIERMVGKGSEHLLRSVLNHVLTQAGKAPEAMEMEALYVRAWPSYQRHYLAINGQFASVYPGVVEGLRALRASGLRLACLTNKPTAFAVPLLCERRAGLVEAVVKSVRIVFGNFIVAMVWAVLLSVTVIASILMLPLLLLTLPWLAYASRALYRSALPV